MAMLVQQSYSKKYKYKYNYNNKFKLKHRWPARISAAQFLPKVKLPRFHFAVVSNFLISDSHCFQPRQNTLILFGSKISPFDECDHIDRISTSDQGRFFAISALYPIGCCNVSVEKNNFLKIIFLQQHLSMSYFQQSLWVVMAPRISVSFAKIFFNIPDM